MLNQSIICSNLLSFFNSPLSFPQLVSYSPRSPLFSAPSSQLIIHLRSDTHPRSALYPLHIYFFLRKEKSLADLCPQAVHKYFWDLLLFIVQF